MRPSDASNATSPASSTHCYTPSRPEQPQPRQRLDKHRGIYRTHKHANVNAWPADNPRITQHFTPTNCSWLNMVEIFFGIITRRAIRRGSFTSVKDLIAVTDAFIDGWNNRCEPFTWTKDLDKIIGKIKRKETYRSRH